MSCDVEVGTQSRTIDSLPVHVAVIGTAGRYDDAPRMNGEVYERMVSCVTSVLREVWRLENKHVILVSGGAPWADHVAVTLFLRSHRLAEGQTPHSQPYGGLNLFMPCAFSFTESEDHDDVTTAASGAAGRRHHAVAVDKSSSGSQSSASSPARVMNDMHAQFSSAVGWNTLDDVAEARSRGATINCDGKSFQARNALVAAAADRVICLTWGTDTAHPKEGSGSRQTWDLCRAPIKLHVPLAQLMGFQSTTTSAAST